MFSQALVFAAFLAIAKAADLGHATSYSSISKHITPVQKVAVAPVTHVAHYAPVAHVAHVAPVHHIAHVAPVHHVAHVAHVAPVHHIAPVHHVAHVAPVAHYSHVAPVAHVAHVAPLVKSVHREVYADAHPHYSFEYGVKDTHTHDIKNQHEERDGDVVKGHYSLLQPDGITRTVHYTADHHNGFDAHVEYSGHASHPQPVHKAVISKTILTPVHYTH